MQVLSYKGRNGVAASQYTLHFSWKRFSNLKHHMVWQHIPGEHTSTAGSFIGTLRSKEHEQFTDKCLKCLMNVQVGMYGGCLPQFFTLIWFLNSKDEITRIYQWGRCLHFIHGVVSTLRRRRIIFNTKTDNVRKMKV
jgi:hypothetical protein